MHAMLPVLVFRVAALAWCAAAVLAAKQLLAHVVSRKTDCALVAKNLVKASVLAFMAPRAVAITWHGVAYGDWAAADIHTLALMYGCTDMCGLLVVPRLRKSTVAHHVFVTALVVADAFTDYTRPTPMVAAVAAGAFASITYPVNMVLAASRTIGFLPQKHTVLLAATASVYTAAILLNAAVQVKLLTAFPLLHAAPLWIAAIFIMFDDVYLLAHMRKLLDVSK